MDLKDMESMLIKVFVNDQDREAITEAESILSIDPKFPLKNTANSQKFTIECGSSLVLFSRIGINEIVGENGSGKSQLCYTLAIDFLEKYMDGLVVYISTEQRFPSNRVYEMLQNRYTDDLQIKQITDRLLVEHVFEPETLLQVLSLYYFDQCRDQSMLIVIDSITAPFRYSTCMADDKERYSCTRLNELIYRLKQLAGWGIGIVCTNQVSAFDNQFSDASTSALMETVSSRLISCVSDQVAKVYKPCLGNTWSSVVDTRILTLVHRRNLSVDWRRAILLRSPLHPPGSFIMQITGLGVVLAKDGKLDKLDGHSDLD